MRLALLHPVGRGHAAGKFGEHLTEHALAAITVDDALVVDEIGRGLADRALRNAIRKRLLLQLRQEAIEAGAVMATGRARNDSAGSSRRRGKSGRHRLRPRGACEHRKSDRARQGPEFHR